MNLSILNRRKAQAAIEYLLLLTVVAVVILIGVKSQNGSVLSRSQNAADGYYNSVTQVIMGKNPQPIDGGWCAPKPSGECECACPAPAFGGKYCVDNTTCRGASSAPLLYCGDQKCIYPETGEAGHPDPAIANDPLVTCFEDCPFQPDCRKCDTMVPVSTCGTLCPDDGSEGAVQCQAGQVCMESDCGSACPGYKQPYCQSEPLLCTASCRCDSLLTPAGKCGSKCGGYKLPSSERCYKFASCTGACTEFEMYVGKVPSDNSCQHCSNGSQDADELGEDCGGVDCASCCGNGRRDPGETCDSTEPGCSSSCLPLTPNCRPTGGYTCGGPTDGIDSVTNQPCSIPKYCDPGEDEVNCGIDCSECIPNGNCIPDGGKYTCGAFTRGHSQNCPTIPCAIPKKCDPTESCSTCPQDCTPGACVADSTYQCGAPTEGHYANCPNVDCVIPQGCDVTETDQTCAIDCKNSCTGAIPENSVACPGADQNVTTATPRTLVGNCTGAKCEYVCGSEYALRFRNGGLEKFCACVGTGCFNPDCQPKEIATQCDGLKVTLPATSDGQESVVPCPEGCVGSVIGSCQKGQYADIYNGGCSAQAACPATSVAKNSTITPNGVPVDCGEVKWEATPANTQGLASCGPNCDGYVMRYCQADGTWAEGYGQSWWGCRPKTGLSCAATEYNPHDINGQPLCGENSLPIHVPEMGNGKTFTSRCGGTCGSGTFSATCVDGTVFYHNNCATAVCGNGVRDGGEVCDGDTIACAAPETGNKSCLPDCSGYGPCSSRVCADLDVSVSPCGSVKLPGVRTGEISSAACPAGCTGTIASQCSGSRFGSISGSCVPYGCSNLNLGTACGAITLPATANGNTSSVTCPIGCTGTLQAKCTNGVFDAVSGFCQPNSCPETTVHTTCGDVQMPETSSGRSQTVNCPSCAGTLTATCTNGVFGVMTGPCAPGSCPAVSQEWGSDPCKVNASLTSASAGASPSISCGPACSGTRKAVCSDDGTWKLEDSCSPVYCTAPKTVSTPCGNATLPGGVLSGSSSSIACPAGCSGSGITAQCIQGSFAQPIINCTGAPCAETTVNTKCGKPVTLGATTSGLYSDAPCPDGCTGTYSARCMVGSFEAPANDCSPIICPATFTDNGCKVEVPGTTGSQQGTCKDGCSGIVNVTCTAQGWTTESGGCSKNTGPCICESYATGYTSATTRDACGGMCNGIQCNSMTQCFHWGCSPEGCTNPAAPTCQATPACGCGDGICTDPINEPELCWTGSDDCCGDGICGKGEAAGKCPDDCCNDLTCDKQHSNTHNYCSKVNGSFSWMSAADLKAACDGPEDCGNTKYWCAAGKTLQCKRNPSYGVYGFVDEPTWPCP